MEDVEWKFVDGCVKVGHEEDLGLAEGKLQRESVSRVYSTSQIRLTWNGAFQVDVKKELEIAFFCNFKRKKSSMV
jgi:hypothetical protein